MEFIDNYIVLVIVGICLCVGYIIKELIPGKKVNRFIPLTLGLLGIALNVWLRVVDHREYLKVWRADLPFGMYGVLSFLKEDNNV